MSYRLFFVFLSIMCSSPLKRLFYKERPHFSCVLPTLSAAQTLQCDGQGSPIQGAYGWFFEAKIDLNRAKWADLVLLRGIGSRLAHRIVAARKKNGRFDSWDCVAQISGIGPQKLKQLKGYFFL